MPHPTGPIPDTIPEGSALRSLRMHNACPAGLSSADGMLVSMNYVPCGAGVSGSLPASLANAKQLEVRVACTSSQALQGCCGSQLVPQEWRGTALDVTFGACLLWHFIRRCHQCSNPLPCPHVVL
jgi:hypothetical protein